MGRPAREDLRRAGFEHVHVELDWYDGPRGGIANVQGAAHYFKAVNAYNKHGGSDDDYLVWPAEAEIVAWEREQWAIFVAWWDRSRAGSASVADHPHGGGVDARYDELEILLAPYRVVPDDARRLTAEWQSPHDHRGYDRDGPGYLVRWEEPAGRPP